MEKEFIPYEQALALKELGFKYVSTIFAYDEAGELYTRSGIPHDFNIRGLLSAPSFSQAFRWFREKYRLDGKPEYFLNNFYCFIINDMKQDDTSRRLFTEFPSYEEAELECLKKLISIIKSK